MREMMFMRCEARAAREAGYWARQILRAAGAPSDDARRAGLRLAAGLRAAAGSFSADAARRVGAVGGAPEGVVIIAERGGRLVFELLAEGDQPVDALVSRSAEAGLWHVGERRVAGDGASRLEMAVWT